MSSRQYFLFGEKPFRPRETSCIRGIPVPKPRVQARVDSHVKDDVEQFAKSRDMSEAEATRVLVNSGLDAETSTATDGGELLEEIGDLQEQQSRLERQDRIHSALLGFALVVGALVVSGVATGPVALAAAVLVGLALIVSSLYPMWGGSDE